MTCSYRFNINMRNQKLSTRWYTTYESCLKNKYKYFIETNEAEKFFYWMKMKNLNDLVDF